MDNDFIVPTRGGRFVSIPHKDAESRRRIAGRDSVRNAFADHRPKRNHRQNQTASVSPSIPEDFPTSGEGWTLK